MERIGVEIEKKYIIKKPDVAFLRTLESFSESEIVQTYIPSAQNETRRVRMRVLAGAISYIETRKIRIDKMSATEIERELTEEEYTSLAKSPCEGSRPIRKTRYTFIYKGQLFELDFYPEWERTCVMETELESRDTEVEFPPFITVLSDVTGMKEYSNAAMSRKFPKELFENEDNG